MKVIVSAGGTGGHIYPALAIIDKIKEMEPDSEFLYIGTHNRMENDIIPKRNIPFKSIEVFGLERKNLLKNFRTLYYFGKSYLACYKMIKEFNPDVVLGVGGYVTGPVLLAAHNLKYKTLIHEQNTKLGKANKFLSKYVDRIAVSFESTLKYIDANKGVFTGNPRGESAINTPEYSKRELGLTPGKKMVLIVMGSLGAGKVNDGLLKSIDLFKEKSYEVLFITGRDHYEKIKNINVPKNVKMLPYLDGLPGAMKIADIIVSRAGATSLSEITALLKPSILIPSPYVANNEQYYNAADLIEKNCAIMIEEKNFTGEVLVNKIDELINNQRIINTMHENLKKVSIPDSATRIYNEIRNLIDRK